MMIHLEKAEKSYPLQSGRTWVLRNVDLDIAEVDFVSVMGPPGAGKSSLLNVLGLIAAGLAMRLLQTQWSGIEQIQQSTLIALGLIAMSLAAVLSALLPAWRASRIDPMTALRNE
jgi:ABC-type lipoprotein export system ATPase subunit